MTQHNTTNSAQDTALTTGAVKRTHCFVAYNTQDAHAERCASWVVAHLRANSSQEVVVPQKTWALGLWDQYLQDTMSKAARIVVVLTPDFIRSPTHFERRLLRLSLQEPLAHPEVQFLAVLAGDCQALLEGEQMREEASVLFTDRVCWVNLTPALSVLESCRFALEHRACA